MAGVWCAAALASAAWVGAAVAETPSSAIAWEPLYEPGSGGWITDVSVSPHDASRVLVAGDMLGVGVSRDGGLTWDSTFGFKSWEIGSVTWHPTLPDTVWAGTMSGPYVSHDGGVNWSPARSGMGAAARWNYSTPIEKVLFDPSDAETLLAVGGSQRGWSSPGSPKWGAVWRSTDGGANWSQLSTITHNGGAAAVLDAAFAAGSSDTVYAAAAGGGFYRSVDGGASWTRRVSGLPHANVRAIAAHPTQADTVYAALGPSGSTPGGVYVSTNGGGAWGLVDTGLPQDTSSNTGFTSGFEAVAIDPGDAGRLFTADTSWLSRGVYRSVNGGAWTKANAGNPSTFYPAGFSPNVLTVSSHDGDVLFAGNSESVTRSVDGGATWSDVTSTSLGGGRWRGTGFSGLVSTNVEFHPTDPQRFVVQGLDAGKLLVTSDGGASWRRQGGDAYNWGGGQDAAFAGEYAYATFGQFGQFHGIGRSTDGGTTWSTLHGAARGLPELRAWAEPAGVYADRTDGRRVWAVIDGDLYRSGDAGESWSASLTTDTLRHIAADPRDGDTFYVSGEGGVFRTSDGVNFAALPLAGGPASAKRGQMDVDGQGRLYLAAHDGTGNAGHGVWRYDPVTQDWDLLFAKSYAVDVAVDPTNPLRLAVATNDQPFHDETAADGVWLSFDGGATWTQQNLGLAMLRGATIAWNPHVPGQLIFGTNGRGFFAATVPEPASLVALLAVGAAALRRHPRGATTPAERTR